MRGIGLDAGGNIEPMAIAEAPRPNLPPARPAGRSGLSDGQDITLATAIDQVAEGVMITDARLRIQYVNPSFTRVTGYAAEEVIGKTPRVVKSGQHDPAFYKHMWETIQAAEVWHGELINRRKDGSYTTEEMSITPLRDSAGTITSYIAIKQDVTARRAAESSSTVLYTGLNRSGPLDGAACASRLSAWRSQATQNEKTFS